MSFSRRKFITNSVSSIALSTMIGSILTSCSKKNPKKNQLVLIAPYFFKEIRLQMPEEKNSNCQIAQIPLKWVCVFSNILFIKFLSKINLNSTTEE